MKKYIFTIAFVIIGVMFSHAQQKVVRGSVYAFKDLCLKNIHVEAKKSGAIVTTDSLGNYTIVCEKRDRLTFTGAGFQRVIKSINRKDTLRIKMMFKQGEENKKMAVGYGIVSEDKLTYAISHLSQYNNEYANYQDIFQIIQGNFAGVQVINNNGRKNVLVRGISSNSPNIFALYVVDGIVVDDISYISPTWIKSIDVLKDGAGAIYGARGGNGVVIISTIK